MTTGGELMASNQKALLVVLQSSNDRYILLPYLPGRQRPIPLQPLRRKHACIFLGVAAVFFDKVNKHEFSCFDVCPPFCGVTSFFPLPLSY